MTVIAIPIGYSETIVTPKTARNVEAYWSFSASEVGRSLVLPDGRCDIILRYNIYHSEPPTPIVTGPATRPYTVQYKEGDSWVGMRFRPHDGAILWSKGIVEAVDTVVRGKDALALLTAHSELKDIQFSAEKFADSLRNRSPRKPDGRLSLLLDAIHASGGRIRIDSLAALTGCTSRQINRIFRANTGLTTKSYAQLVQFHRTLKLIQAEKLPISDAAFEGGYSDHAHLTRAFKRFGGFVPSKIPANLSLPVLTPS